MKRIIFVAALVMLGFNAIGAAQQPAANAAPPDTPARRLAFSPDGKSLAIAYGTLDRLVVWDLAVRRPRLALREKAVINSVAYSLPGDLLAIGVGPMAKLLDPKSGEVLRELNAHQQTVNGVAFTPDGKQLATAGTDGRVKLWDAVTGTEQHVFASPKGPILSTSISADGKWLAAACGDDAVHVWNLQLPAQPPRRIDPLGTEGEGRVRVTQVVFSPDTRFLANLSSGFVPIVDVASGNRTLQYKHGGHCVSFSPDGKWMASAAYDRNLDLASFQQTPDDRQRREIAALIEQFQNDDYATRESASRQLVELGGVAFGQLRAGLESPIAEVRVRCRRVTERLQDLRFAKKLVGHEAEPTWVAFSPDGRLLASGDSKGIVKLWTIPDGKDAGTLTPDGKFIPPTPPKAAPAA